MKTAILISGHIRNSHSTLKTFYENVVLPSNADVFCLFVSNSSYDCEHFPFTSSDGTKLNITNEKIEKEFKNVFGTHLKSFEFVNEANHATQLQTATQICNKNAIPYGDLLKKMNSTSAYHYYIQEGVVSSRIIDQYVHVKNVLKSMIEYEKQNHFNYDCVVRTRIDRMNIVGQCEIQNKFENIQKNDDGSIKETLFFEGIYPWFVDCFFFGTRVAMVRVCDEFVEKMCSFIDINQENTLIERTMSPEVQIALFSRQLEKEGVVITRSYMPRKMTVDENNIKCTNCFIYNIFF